VSAHKPSWGPVETEMMNTIFSPEVLRARVPGMGEILDGAEHLRAMHEEIGTLGQFRQANGFTNDRSMQRVAKIDTEIMVMLDHLHEASCMCGKSLWGTDGHKAWFYHWLEGPGAWADIRGKIQLST